MIIILVLVLFTKTIRHIPCYHVGSCSSPPHADVLYSLYGAANASTGDPDMLSLDRTQKNPVWFSYLPNFQTSTPLCLPVTLALVTL